MQLKEKQELHKSKNVTFLKHVTKTENVQKCKTGVQSNINANKMCGDHNKDVEEQPHEEVGGWQNVTFLSLLFKAAALQLPKCNLRKHGVAWKRVWKLPTQALKLQV